MKQPVAVVGGIRIPFCRMGSAYLEYSGVQLMTEVVTRLVDQFNLKGEKLGEVVLGTVFQHPSTWNFARDAMLPTGLSPETPSLTLARACATSLDAASVVAMKIAEGRIEAGIAGGAESMSGLPLFLAPTLARRFIENRQAKSLSARLGILGKIRPSDLRFQPPPSVEPSTQKLMGQHAEQMAQHWGITRVQQDELALQSHLNGSRAYERGFYDDLVVPFAGARRDNTLRGDTSLEKLARLKPSFDRSQKGTLTAGNSSPLTDGAACVLLASEEWAKRRGLPVLAYLTDFENAAIDPKAEGLLMAPAYAVARMLARRKEKLQDFTFYEIHEAFAAQVLCTLRAWEDPSFAKEKLGWSEPLGSIDRSRLNTAGGSVALGHPFGATGARIVATLAKLLAEKSSGKGLISICTGGGMGTVAVMERG